MISLTCAALASVSVSNGMKGTVDGIHVLGMKAGTYSDAGSWRTNLHDYIPRSAQIMNLL